MNDDSAGQNVSRRAHRRLLTTLMMRTALCLGAMPIVLPVPQAAAQTARTHSFNIPSQPLNRALRSLADQTGVQIAYQTSIAAGTTSPAVTGTMSTEQALAQLLSGSGLRYSFTNANTVTILSATASGGGSIAADGALVLDTITVEGQGETAWGPVNGIVATRSASGTKTDTSLLETPASVSVISRKQVEEQGAQSISDAVRTTPSVLTQWGGYDNRYDLMFVRGFAPTTFLNGLILPTGSFGTHGSSQVEPYGLERIEVLRGSASALYGQTPAGGILNLVSKRPTSIPFGEIQLQTGSYERKQVAFDFGGPLTEDGTFLYRLTGLGRLADTQVDYVDEKRGFIAPSFTWQPTADTTFTFLSSYLKVDSDYAGFYPQNGTLYSHPKGRIGISRFLGEPGFGGFEREAGTIGYSFEHRFNDAVSFKQNLQYGFQDTLTEGIAARRWVDDSQQLVWRNANSFLNNGKTFSVDNQLTMKLNTGPLSHTILTGVDYQNFKNEYWYRGGANLPNPIDPFNPVYTGYTPSSWNTYSHTNQRLSQFGVYAQDQIHYDRWLLTLSGRHDWASVDNFNYLSGATTDRSDSAFSGRIGLNYLFEGGWSPYVSYSNSFLPIVGTTFSGDTFKPTRSSQIEAGIKYQPEGLPIFAALSVFDITRTNIATADPINEYYQVQAGEARVRGVELEVKATLMNNLALTAAYTYSHSKFTKTNDSTEWNGVDIPWFGKQLPFVPEHQASIWANYRFDTGTLDGLTLGAGLRYVGSLYGDNANQLKSPATTFVDIAASYDFGKRNPELQGLNLRLNVRNLFNEYYTSCTGENACYIGEGRSALVTLTKRW